MAIMIMSVNLVGKIQVCGRQKPNGYRLTYVYQEHTNFHKLSLAKWLNKLLC